MGTKAPDPLRYQHSSSSVYWLQVSVQNSGVNFLKVAEHATQGAGLQACKIKNGQVQFPVRNQFTFH